MSESLQIGTYPRFVAGHAAGEFEMPSITVTSAITLTPAQIAAPGPLTAVTFTAPYYPCYRGTYPVRAGSYRAGDTASFPQAEAAALVAAGIAEYPV